MDIEAMKEKLTKAREEKEQMEREMANKTHEAAKLRRKWINGVESLVENINDRFGSMMAELGYAGQITLSQGKREIDFSSYGVKIQVGIFVLQKTIYAIIYLGQIQGWPRVTGSQQRNSKRRREIRDYCSLHDGTSRADASSFQMC